LSREIAIQTVRSRTKDRAFVSDFDGTITDFDVYAIIAERYLPTDHRDYFADHRAGRLTHFEAMQAFFHFAPSEPHALDRLLRDTTPDPQLADCVRRLDANGWDLIIVSAGSSWYIERILETAGVSATVHSNPGQIEEGRGLVLRLPEESPFFSPQVGIDKAEVVRFALERYKKVAFAGDGPPDIEPALLVAPSLRFARRFLAQALDDRGEPYQPYRIWSEVVEALLANVAET
jgi:2-hydroxy-3-keto-5-methylthiopentenyl-1-phosphate phosphatase